MAARLPDPTAEHAVEDGMFRVLAWLRLVVMANMLGFAAVHREAFVHPAAAAVVLGLLVLWSLVVIGLYADHRRRSATLLVADLGVAVGALLVTPWLKGDDFSATVPGFWVMAAVLVWAAHWGGRGGFVAAAVVAVCDLGIRWPSISESNYGNVFLLLIGGPLLGRLGSALKDLAAERDAAQRAAALAEERARLGRAVHDGVLQVLALMQRKGPELGGEGVELGRLAGEQEAHLRALLQTGSTAGTGDPRRLVDLGSLVNELGTRRTPTVHVAAPATPVLVSQYNAAELVAAAGAALDNVAVHVGEAAPAWVLLEDLPDRIVLSIRDEGPGIPDGRIEAAESEGRLGVSESIVGRTMALGGAFELHTGAHGTEWELWLPKELADR